MEKSSFKNIHKFIKPYLIEDGSEFRLKDHDPADTHHLRSADKPEAQKRLTEGVMLLSQLQDMLFAQSNWGVLLIFQAMDAAGKDGTIKHVMSGVNPQGVDVFSFKAPSTEEIAHDFMWRTNRCLPPRGKIGIFNRSYYEEVLVVRVHPELLNKQKIPKEFCDHHLWRSRFEDINAFEKYLTRNGIAIRKFFLNISKKEQKHRFMERLDNPEKNWKFSARGCSGKEILEGLPISLRKNDPQHRDETRALGGCARGQQVVHPSPGCDHDCGRVIRAKPEISQT